MTTKNLLTGLTVLVAGIISYALFWKKDDTIVPPPSNNNNGSNSGGGITGNEGQSNFDGQKAVEYAKAIAEDLGVGWYWSATEEDEKAVKKVIALSLHNYSVVGVAYNSLFERDLTVDMINLVDNDIKKKYKAKLSVYGIA